MKHIDEINEIQDLLSHIRNDNGSDMFENCPLSRGDEELSFGVSYISGADADLPCDIIVDTSGAYKHYNHPLCLFVVNGDNVIPVTISNPPRIKEGCKVPPEVLSFIMENIKPLTDAANPMSDTGDLYDAIDQYVERKKSMGFIAEMANLPPEKTGLPVWVYVDDTGSYQKSAHNESYRFKFQQDRDIVDSRLWMPVRIPDLEIMTTDTAIPCKIPQRDVNKVLLWAKGNLDLLIKLRDKEIKGKEFKAFMKKYKDIKVLLKSECK